MSLIESPAETVRKFASTPGWQEAPIERLTGDFLSVSHESNFEWDRFVYEERGGKLFDPLRGFIDGSANGDRIEEEINTQLEKWFSSHDSGIAVWISPRRPSWYPEEKIVIYRIAYSASTEGVKKVLLGASHQFKTNFKNPEDIRRFIFTEDDKEESILEIVNWLKRVSQKKVETSTHNLEEKSRQAEYYAYRYKSGVSIENIIYEMNQSGFLGQNPISCGAGNTTQKSSYFETITPALHFVIEGWHSGICRICGASTEVGPCNVCKICEKNF